MLCSASPSVSLEEHAQLLSQLQEQARAHAQLQEQFRQLQAAFKQSPPPPIKNQSTFLDIGVIVLQLWAKRNENRAVRTA